MIVEQLRRRVEPDATVLLEPEGSAYGVILVDVGCKLPRIMPARPRDPKRIKYIGFHHTGALGNPGFQGLLDMTMFAIHPKEYRTVTDKKTGKTREELLGRGFRTTPYHVYVPFADDLRLNCRIVYCCLRDDELGSNIENLNTETIGCAVQGNTTQNGLSKHQLECLSVLMPYLLHKYRLGANGFIEGDRIVMHSEADHFIGRSGKPGHGKPACPGAAATAWVKNFRQHLKDHPQYME